MKLKNKGNSFGYPEQKEEKKKKSIIMEKRLDLYQTCWQKRFITDDSVTICLQGSRKENVSQRFYTEANFTSFKNKSYSHKQVRLEILLFPHDFLSNLYKWALDNPSK